MRWAWTVPLASCTSVAALVHPPLAKPPVVLDLLNTRSSVRPLYPTRRLPERSTIVLSSAITSPGESAGISSSRTEDNLAVTSLPLPPKDDTYRKFPPNLFRELRAAPKPAPGSERFTKIGTKTGGIWRSKFLGFQPVTVVAPSLATSWLANEEGNGNTIQSWPESLFGLLGRNAIATVGEKTAVHSMLRGLYYEKLSPKAVVKLASHVESSLAKRSRRWDQMAKTGESLESLFATRGLERIKYSRLSEVLSPRFEEMRLFEELCCITMEVILYAFLGDYASEEVLEQCLILAPEVIKGVFTVNTRKFWWPLNRVFPFNYGRSMKARKEFDALIEGVVEERRSARATANKDARTAGVMDRLIDVQAEQRAAGGPKPGEIEYDDNFIYSNLLFAIMGGYETSSATLTRLLEYLESDGSKELNLKERLIEELQGTLASSEDRVEDESSHSSSNYRGSGAKGVFRAYPLVDAAIVETNRMSPAAGGVFRKMKKATNYNGYLIPEGETVLWSLIDGYVSESVYPEPTKFCPFRFLQGDSIDAGASPSVKEALSPAEAKSDQPRPALFGFGKHLCPGKELAKLEIIVFLRFFLPKYNYRIVEGQNLKGSFVRSAPREGLRVILTATGA